MTRPEQHPSDPPVAEQPAPQGKPATPAASPKAPMPKEIGGPTGPEPTRYNDWERKGRVSDF